MKHWAKLKQKLLQRDSTDEYLEFGIFKEIKENSIVYDFSKLPFDNVSNWPVIEIPHTQKTLTTEELKSTLDKDVDNTGNV